jgi:hypothetical protein
MNQETTVRFCIEKMKTQQPKIAASLPDEGEVGTIPFQGKQFPFLAFGNIIFCPWEPLP